MKSDKIMTIVLIITIVAAFAAKIFLGTFEFLVLGIAGFILLIWHLNRFSHDAYFYGYNGVEKEVKRFGIISSLYVPILYAGSLSLIPEVFSLNWVSFLWCIVIILYIIINTSKNTQNEKIKKMSAAKIIKRIDYIYLAVFSVPMIGVFTYWGSQKIWLVLAFITVASVLQKAIYDKMYIGREETICEFSAGLALIISLISTIVQFWSSIVSFLLLIWDFIKSIRLYVIVIVILLGVIFGVIKLFRYLARIREEKEEGTRREEQERREAEQKEICRQEKEEKRSVFLLTLTETVDWSIVRSLWNENEVPEQVLFSKPIFYERSDEKQKICFNPCVVGFLLKSWNVFYNNTMDDKKIKKLKSWVEKQLIELETFKNYDGFSALKEYLEEKLEFSVK
ncbi:MAG TPA: hypothetical protein PKX34_00585 [Candidatus Absconditabacterales bacterium]|nr:hypothetical protein [Candidatus Absconditabacterales bacterium]HPK27700.1 hypothetical protein [Candidatus Absconditabacterales bacterium]